MTKTTKESLSKSVFERRTCNPGSESFSPLSCHDASKFEVLSVFSLEETICRDVQWQARIYTTWPSFPFTCRLLFIISTHKLVVSRNFLSNKNCFELFLSAHFLFWEILNLNLTFVVCRLPYTQSLNSLIFGHNYCSRMQKILFRRVDVCRYGKETFLLKPPKVKVWLGVSYKKKLP